MVGHLERLPPTDRLGDVLAALGRYVEGSGLRPGDRLPAERELLGALGVGRSTIREAMSRLQALGVVETRKGSGSYLLREMTGDTLHMPLSIAFGTLRDAMLQALEVRRALEVEASARAALRASPADLAQMRDKLEIFEQAFIDGEGAAGRADLAFHLSIYDAAHNPLFRQLLEQMREAFDRFFSEPFDRRDFASRSFPFHRELFEAIAARDADAARAKTIAILDIVEEDLDTMST